jgi:hypothetical protein
VGHLLEIVDFSMVSKISPVSPSGLTGFAVQNPLPQRILDPRSHFPRVSCPKQTKKRS